MFPVEILEIFFKHSSGVDIINFRDVCKTWKNIIDRLSNDTNLWKVKCADEIPIHYCHSIFNKLYPNKNLTDLLHTCDDNLKWLKTYQSWIKWQRIRDTQFNKEQFEPFFVRLPMVKVTCVTVSGNLIAVGSSEGFIAFYNIDRSTKEPFFIVDQMEYVCEIEFFRDDDRIIALSTSTLYHVTLWDVQYKKSVGKKQYGRLISTAQRCIWIAMTHKLSVQSKNVKRIYEFLEIRGVVVALVADGEQAFVWTDLGYSYKVNVNNPGADCIEEFVEPPAEPVSKYYLFMPWIAVCITGNGFLGISVNNKNWVMYEILSKLHGVPTCVLLYTNVLVLGLDSGSVHMYNINVTESLDTLDFRSENSKLIVVDNQAIVALDIMDRPDKQYLIAATVEKVNVIEIRDFE